jgi:hypothetical protein
MAPKTGAKTPLIDNLALKLASLYYRKDRADARAVRQLAGLHSNPPPVCEDFLDGSPILPEVYPRFLGGRGYEGGKGLWDIAFINGSGRVSPPPHGEAGDIVVQDSVLKLQVRHDPNFNQKRSKWQKGFAAAEKYNNAYIIGMGGFMPTPRQSILVQCRMKISPDFHGSTGIWVQEMNTFDPKTGIMVKPFRSFGFSYLGEASDPYIRGLAMETVLGLSIQDKQTAADIDVTAWHTYTMRWSWTGTRTQRVEFRIDDQDTGYFNMHPFGPAEIQFWADNYQIGRGLKIGYLNVPGMDETSYDWIRITPIDA